MEPLLSDFADDAEMVELIEMFTSGLDDTCRNLVAGLDAGDVELVRRIGHQLKGSGGGYGYPTITDAGGRLEQSVTRAGAINDEVRSCAETLIGLCRRAEAGNR